MCKNLIPIYESKFSYYQSSCIINLLILWNSLKWLLEAAGNISCQICACNFVDCLSDQLHISCLKLNDKSSHVCDYLPFAIQDCSFAFTHPIIFSHGFRGGE